MNNTINVSLVMASVRPERQGDRALQFIRNAVQQRSWTTNIIDPAKESIPFIQYRYIDYEANKMTPPASLQSISEKLKASDAFIFISAEYNYSVPPALTNLVDHFRSEFTRKPVGIVTYSYGPFAGVRAGVQLYSLVPALGAVAVPLTLPIPSIQAQLDETGKPINEDMHKFAKEFLDEVEWYTHALRAARA